MKIIQNISLKLYNTFGIDAIAAEFAEITEVDELLDMIKATKLQHTKHLILGGGSNILFTNDYDGLVIRISIGGIQVKETRNSHVLVKAGAGVVWDDLVRFCMDKGYGGIENLVMIPGSVGAGPIQNIGAYGVELKDTFHSLEAINIASGEMKVFEKQDCKFAYRDSIFKRDLKGEYVIISVTLLLQKDHIPDVSYGAIKEELMKMGLDEQADIKAVGDAVTAIRQKKLPNPALIGNAGSFFKNPVVDEEKFNKMCNLHPDIPSYKSEDGSIKVPAGWMIEQCGWKGKILGNAAVHDKQALVLVNKGDATGRDVLMLAKKIKQSVFDRFDVMLEMEVNVV
jgi:UDP-N-acetylmuramate dehydrogenase